MAKNIFGFEAATSSQTASMGSAAVADIFAGFGAQTKAAGAEKTAATGDFIAGGIQGITAIATLGIG